MVYRNISVFDLKFQSVKCIEFEKLQTAKNGSLSKTRGKTIEPDYQILFEDLLNSRRELIPVITDLIS